MALVVLLRGVNVGGHRAFRPSVLAGELRAFGVVNIGAAGTFVVRKPGSRAAFTAALRKKLPFETEVIVCDDAEFLGIAQDHLYGGQPAPAGTVRFVSVLAAAAGAPATMPVHLPDADDWLVRIIGAKGRYVFGEYRRHMKTITYLGKVDKLFGCAATTRNWNTVTSICKVLAAGEADPTAAALSGARARARRPRRRPSGKCS